ncbi:MAG: hypothetical protein ACFFDN_46795, partial [Candidatus Hodarchaeota archaeon]
MALKDLVYFKEKENFEGKKDISLIINCYNCPQKEKFLSKSNICIDCLLSTLFAHRDRKFNYKSVLWNDILIKEEQFNSILEYFTFLKKIRKINEKIEKIRIQKCNFKEFKCEIFPEFSSLHKIKDNDFYDPIFVY